MTVKDFIEEYKFADFDSYELERTPFHRKYCCGEYEKEKIKIVFVDNAILKEYQIKEGKVRDYLNNNVIAIIVEHYEELISCCWTKVIVRANSYLSKDKYIDTLRSILIDKVLQLSPDEIKDILKELEE